jgi:hypothetical protein
VSIRGPKPTTCHPFPPPLSAHTASHSLRARHPLTPNSETPTGYRPATRPSPPHSHFRAPQPRHHLSSSPTPKPRWTPLPIQSARIPSLRFNHTH